MTKFSTECRTLVDRLKGCDLDEICRNPSAMLKYYPIRNPDNEATVFDELYCVLNRQLLTKTYKYRIFYFLNTFLSSTKVPAYVIAAYLKKLSRLSLHAKPRTLAFILKIVGNLFLRHPTLMILRDRVDEKARNLNADSCTLRWWLENDPFDEAQTTDLKATNAMDSCVWELMPLRYHRQPRIASIASYLNGKEVIEMEFDLEGLVK